jgi:hypothetical protein
MDTDESSSGNTLTLELQSASSKLVHPKDALAEFNDAPEAVRSFDGEEETFLALKQLEAEREVQVSGCFQKYVSFRPYIVAWIYDTCLRCFNRYMCACNLSIANIFADWAYLGAALTLLFNTLIACFLKFI